MSEHDEERAAAPACTLPVQPMTMLIVDDDAVFRERLARALDRRGFAVRTAGDADQALAAAQSDPPELAVVDLRMPGRSGLDLVRELQALDPTTRVLVLTGYGSIATAVEAMRRGAASYLPKPADVDDILGALGVNDRPDSDGERNAGEVPSLARVEWEHINRVLGDCDGNVSEAARRLGMHRRSLQRKLHKFAPRR